MLRTPGNVIALGVIDAYRGRFKKTTHIVNGNTQTTIPKETRSSK
jgi:hypothetical protein